MARSKSQPRPAPRPAPARAASAPPPTVSGRWLLGAIAIAIPGAAFCAWGVLCLLFWQGSWQLLYHPEATVARTPASIGLAFDAVGFDPTDTGTPQLQGWWIPAATPARITFAYLHGQNGNLGDTLDDLALLHGAGVNVLAFDYRGYGQSQFVHPGEANWRQDAEAALEYLEATRHIDPHTIVLGGSGLGANLALEVAAAHPELAGAVFESPVEDAADAIFRDPRSRLVPAHLLTSDRYAMIAPAAALRIPTLWLLQNAPASQAGEPQTSQAFDKVNAAKMRVWLTAPPQASLEFKDALSRWLDDLPNR